MGKVNKRARKFKKVQVKVRNTWTEQDIEDALHELDSVPGKSIRAVAAQYGLEESTLRFRLRKRKANEDLGKGGRR